MVDIVKPDISSVWAESGAVIAPSNEKIKMGWTSEVPPHQYENFVQNRQDEMLAYLNQKGVPEWRIDTEYFSGKSFVQDAGKIYKANKNSGGLLPNQKPSTDATNEYWEQATFSLSDLKQAVGASTKDVMSQKAVTDALSTKANTSTQVIAGTGLSGGGNLSANRTLSVNYGTTAGTAAQGNDSRITGAAQKEANLSDLSSAPAARQNLGLGTAASRDVGVSSGNVMQVGAGGLLTGEVTNWDNFTTVALNQGVRTEMGSGVNLNNPYGIYDTSGRTHHFAFGNPDYLAGLFCDGDDGTENIKLVFYAYIAGGRRRFAVISHSGNLKQSIGQETMYPMSQKAVTDAINNSAIGVGQTWQDMVGSRSWGTTYTNTTGRPIQVFITANGARLTVDGVNFVTGNVDGEFSVVVPNGATYSATGSTAIDSGKWMELR